MIAVEVIFWISVGLLVFAQLGYPLLLGIWGKLSRRRAQQPKLIIAGDEPFVTLVIAAHREQSVIASRVANARQLDWPAERLEVIVACDGSPDETAAEARSAGADVVLELEWGGKVRAQDAAVAAADPRSTVIALINRT